MGTAGKGNHKVDVERAKVTPAGEFKRPDDVVKSEALSAREKHKALDQWEVDAQALSRANDEGMTGGEPTKLPEVQKARREAGARPLPATQDRRTSGKPAR